MVEIVDERILIGFPVIVLAGFLNAFAGGGGLINLPLLYLLGLNPQQAIATNKMLALIGNTAGAVGFVRSGLTDLRLVKACVPWAVLGSVVGSQLALWFFNDAVFKFLVLVLSIVIGYLVLSGRKVGLVHGYTVGPLNTRKGMLYTLLFALYDGFFGPGSSTFFIYGLAYSLKMDFLHASANVRLLNVVTNFCSFVLFALQGHTLFGMGLVLGIAFALGNVLGVRFAMLKGNAFIRYVFVGILVLLVLQVLFKSA